MQFIVVIILELIELYINLNEHDYKYYKCNEFNTIKYYECYELLNNIFILYAIHSCSILIFLYPMGATDYSVYRISQRSKFWQVKVSSLGVSLKKITC